MPIKTGPYLNSKDIYIDYPFEQVMFRREKSTGNIYRKFYGEKEHEKSIPHENNLFNNALLSGEEISPEEYVNGKTPS